MKKRIWGLLVLIVVIVASGLYYFMDKNKKEEVSITGLIGGEKIGLVESDNFKDSLMEKYKLDFDYKKDGSLDMVENYPADIDYLFPSSELALELFKHLGGSAKQSEIVFNTPIVLYSRKLVVDGLIKEGIASKEGDVYYVDMVKLASLMKEEKTWADIGLNDLYGRILVDTTDPNKSNSGNMFLGLLANALNGNKSLRNSDLTKLKEDLKSIYGAIGYMQGSSSDMFNQFLRQGVGAYPIIAGYESQLLEFSKTDKEMFEKIKDDVIMLYPKPTVYSSHVYIALTDKGKLGLLSLMDSKVQKMAWEEHGFRTVVAGSEDKDSFDVKNLDPVVKQVMSMPRLDIMLELMKAVE